MPDALETLAVFTKACTLGAYALGVVECIVYYKEREREIQRLAPADDLTAHLLREARLETVASLVIFPVLCAVSWPFAALNNVGWLVTHIRDE
jgi:hypothetical protein